MRPGPALRIARKPGKGAVQLLFANHAATAKIASRTRHGFGADGNLARVGHEPRRRVKFQPQRVNGSGAADEVGMLAAAVGTEVRSLRLMAVIRTVSPFVVAIANRIERKRIKNCHAAKLAFAQAAAKLDYVGTGGARSAIPADRPLLARGSAFRRRFHGH